MSTVLTIPQAYRAMYYFVRQYQERGGSREILLMLDDMMYDGRDSTSDPATWRDWMKCVEKSLSEPPDAGTD
ncbi:MAG: hypothetical protein U0821_16230 [Chloroflexota bacterium]